MLSPHPPYIYIDIVTLSSRCAKGTANVSALGVKRDLLQCQKRPTTVSKETYYSVKVGVLRALTYIYIYIYIY